MSDEVRVGDVVTSTSVLRWGIVRSDRYDVWLDDYKDSSSSRTWRIEPGSRCLVLRKLELDCLSHGIYDIQVLTLKGVGWIFSHLVKKILKM